MIIAKILLLGVLGAFIGYITNMVAIKLLFRPVLPVKILGFTLQGLLPRRRKEIANNIATTVEEELLNTDVLMEKLGLSDGLVGNMLRGYLENKIDFHQLIEDKINEMDVLEIERIIIGLAKKELKHIELMGGFLGFFIGIVQALIVIWL